MPFTIRALDATTWDAFADLVERNNGVFGGCWCVGYHPERGQGVARAALEGALNQIAGAGGGVVEAVSETVADREAAGRFLFSGAVELFEEFSAAFADQPPQ